MNKTLFVHKVDSRTYLNEEIKSRIFAQELFFAYKIKQIAFAGIF